MTNMSHNMYNELFGIALSHFLSRYNAYYDCRDREYVFPFGVDTDGPVTYHIAHDRILTVQEINHYDAVLTEMGFLSTP